MFVSFAIAVVDIVAVATEVVGIVIEALTVGRLEVQVSPSFGVGNHQLAYHLGAKLSQCLVIGRSLVE